MKVSGITIVKNAVEYDYPVVESITSLLPLVDEMIVSIGDCTDATVKLIAEIASPKIKIIHTIWNKQLTSNGTVLAVETNKALAQVTKDSDWIIYLQADEVLHEADVNVILQAMQLYKNDTKVEGLLFNYKHFYGSYNYVGDSRCWYKHEIRIVKNNINVQSYKDAQGFRINNKKLRVKKIAAYIYHYGWVRTPNAQLKKLNNFYTYWGGTTNTQIADTEMYDYLKNVDSIAKYEGTHPSIMQQRIANNNWEITYDVKLKNFTKKDWILYKIEKWTGKRLFDYKNYKIV